MLTKLLLAAALTLLVAGSSAALSTNANAFTLDGCPTATPQATLTVGQQPDSATGYPSANPLCQRFIVDVRAPYTGVPFEIDERYAGPATGPTGALGSGLPLSESDCNLYREYVAVYKKPWFTLSPPADFTVIGSAWFDAHMVPADNDPDFPSPRHCERRLIAGSLPPGLNTGSWPLGATYRVAVSVGTTAPQKVRVHTSWAPIPK
jgi:hypothetical protein